MTRFFTTASLIAVSFAAAQASAAVVLMDATTNNGSFEVITPGESGGNSTQTGASGGERYANSGGTALAINGWSFTKNTTFGGVNHSDSGKADDGLAFAQTNSGGNITGTSSAITFDLVNGNQFQVQGAFSTQFDDNGSYSLDLIFDPAGTADVVSIASGSFVPADNIGGGGSAVTPVAYNIQIDDDSTIYAGSATTVALRFSLTAGSSTNAIADDFRITQVPEPGSLALLGLGGLLIARRRRG